MNQSFTFYGSFADALDAIPDKGVRYEVMDAIITYGTKGIVLDELSPYAQAMFALIKPNIDTNLKKRIGGAKGGRPPKKETIGTKSKKPMVSEEKNHRLQETKTKEDEAEVSEPEETEKQNIPYQEVVDLYNSVCTSLPRVRGVSDSRRNAIRSRYKAYGMDGIKKVFDNAEESDFLSGRNGKWSSCNFDWLMKQANFLKVYEGTYENKGGGNNDLSGGNPQKAQHKLFADEYI